jgi:hypothetical protein
MPEISEHELQQLYARMQHLEGRAQIADVIEPIYNDPLLNKEAKALIKKKYPNAQIPDYDLEQQFNKRFDEEKAAREKIERDRAESEQKQQWQAKRGEVQKEYGFTSEGMEDLEKFMVERNIGDYEVAASYRASKNPKQSDATHHDGFWHHQQQDGWGDIAKDPEGWAHKEIYGALVRDQERAKGGR